jgi:Excalibur calcium-binding domain
MRRWWLVFGLVLSGCNSSDPLPTPTSDGPNYALLTAAALPPPSATPTGTSLPTLTAAPTDTAQPPTELPTDGPTAKPTTKPIAPKPTSAPPTARPVVNTPVPPPTSAPISGGTNFDTNGDGKVTCADFATRAEATVALKAGHTGLDNDSDGIPCESLP